MSFVREAHRALLVCLAFGFASAPLSAATWVLGTASGYPGDTVSMPISIKGDGSTVGADLRLSFSNTRLFVDSPAGALPLGAAGQCHWNGADTIASLVVNGTNTPFPATATLVCTVQFRILDNAPVGTTLVRSGGATCASGSGTATVCSVQGGAITVLGNPPLAREDTPIDSLELIIRLTPAAYEDAQSAAGKDTTEAIEWVPRFDAVEGMRIAEIRPLIRTAHSSDTRLRYKKQPDLPEAMLARSVVVRFSNAEDLKTAQAALLRDPQVEGLERAETLRLDALPARRSASKLIENVEAQDHYRKHQLPAAWERAKGWGLIGMLDNGIDSNHPELRSFKGPKSLSGDRELGGNYLPYLSGNVAGHGQPSNDPEETQNQPLSVSNVDNDAVCDGPDSPNGIPDGYLQFKYFGHGAHVAGLLAANASDDVGVRGTCVNCGIAVQKMSYLFCVAHLLPITSDSIQQLFDTPQIVQALTAHITTGVQVMNFSGGGPGTCTTASTDTYCKAIASAAAHDVVLVASSGNNRTNVQFPARHTDAVSVGGVFTNGTFWDQYPNGCPEPGENDQCGSNYNMTPSNDQNKQEFVAVATDVWSTYQAGILWNEDISCGDGFGLLGHATDGWGPCTGTSMSSPQVAGIFGLLRSVNPLMPSGNPFRPTTNPFTRAIPSPNPFSREAYGVRDVVAQTTDRAQQGLGNDPKYGFGLPDADAAVRKVLGQVRGEQMKNRLTPLFNLYSSANTDYAAVATPQMAMSLSFHHAGAFRSVPQGTEAYWGGLAIPGYPSYPNVYFTNEAARQPRASALVLTTHVSPVNGSPPLVPLILMERRAAQGAPDFILLTSPATVQSAADSGYRYLGQQGYVYAYCAPSPTCQIPPGAQALYLRCNTSASVKDCAVFLGDQMSEFTNRGYTANFLSAGSNPLGFAYPITDADADKLPDAYERLMGTSTNHNDSDGDGVQDGVEFPFANAPVSDPCQGPAVVCPRPAWYVFADHFE